MSALGLQTDILSEVIVVCQVPLAESRRQKDPWLSKTLLGLGGPRNNALRAENLRDLGITPKNILHHRQTLVLTLPEGVELASGARWRRLWRNDRLHPAA